MANVLIEEQTMSDIAAAIREKNGTENTYLPSEMPQAIKDIEDTGVGSRQWWLEAYSGRTDYTDAFKYFTADEFPLIDTSNAKTMIRMFYASKLKQAPKFDLSKCTDLTAIYFQCTDLIECSFINTENVQNITNSFYQCNSLLKVRLGNLVNCKNFANAFFNCAKLTEIIGLNFFNAENVEGMFRSCYSLKSLPLINAPKIINWNNTFIYCNSLENISFALNSIKASISLAYSKLLSDESIQSIIDGLADLTGQDSQVLTLHSDLEDKISDEQKAYVVSKNWQLAFA